MPAGALVFAVGSCAASPDVSAPSSVSTSVAAVTVVPASTTPVDTSTTSSSSVPSSTTVALSESSPLDCVADTAPESSKLALPAGFGVPPHGTEFVGGQARDSVFQLTWELPALEDSTEEPSPGSVIQIKLWTADDVSAMPPVSVPWWVADYGFPESTSLDDEVLGSVAIDVLFENRPGDNVEFEDWYVFSWSLGDLSIRMLTRGLPMDDAVAVGRSVKRNVEVDSRAPFTPSQQMVDTAFATTGLTIQEALPVFVAAGLCDVEFVDLDANVVSVDDPNPPRIIGIDFRTPDRFWVTTDR